MAGNLLDEADYWMWRILSIGLAFQDYPDGDPDAWRDLGERWKDLGDALQEGMLDINTNVLPVSTGWGGDAGNGFQQGWNQVVSDDKNGPVAYINAAYDYYDACNGGAMQLEFSQMMLKIIVMLTIVEFLIGIALSEFGGEALSAEAVAAGRPMISKVLEMLANKVGQQILKKLLQAAARFTATAVGKILLGGLKMAINFAAADLLAQLYQVGKGTRDHVNWGQVGVDAASGFAGGLVGGIGGALAGKLLGGPLSRALLGKLGENGIRTELGGLLAKLGAKELTGIPAKLTGKAIDATVAGVANIPAMAAMDFAGNTVANIEANGLKGSDFGFSKDFINNWKNHPFKTLAMDFGGGAVPGLVHGLASGHSSGVHITPEGRTPELRVPEGEAIPLGGERGPGDMSDLGAHVGNETPGSGVGVHPGTGENDLVPRSGSVEAPVDHTNAPDRGVTSVTDHPGDGRSESQVAPPPMVDHPGGQQVVGGGGGGDRGTVTTGRDPSGTRDNGPKDTRPVGEQLPGTEQPPEGQHLDGQPVEPGQHSEPNQHFQVGDEVRFEPGQDHPGEHVTDRPPSDDQAALPHQRSGETPPADHTVVDHPTTEGTDHPTVTTVDHGTTNDTTTHGTDQNAGSHRADDALAPGVLDHGVQGGTGADLGARPTAGAHAGDQTRSTQPGGRDGADPRTAPHGAEDAAGPHGPDGPPPDGETVRPDSTSDRLDSILSRPDVPEETRPHLEEARDSYQEAENHQRDADEARADADRHLNEARERAEAGDTLGAQQAAREAGAASSRAAESQRAADTAKGRADRALDRARGNTAEGKEAAPSDERPVVPGGTEGDRVPVGPTEHAEEPTSGSHRAEEPTGGEHPAEEPGSGRHRAGEPVAEVPPADTPPTEAPHPAEPGQHTHDPHREVHHREPGGRSNADVLANGTDVPMTMDSVEKVADAMGVDQSDVDVRILDPERDADEIRYLDHMEASAVTRVGEDGKIEVAYGPAAFADERTLATNVAHEDEHVQQFRKDPRPSTETRQQREAEAYASEGPKLEQFDQNFRGFGDDAGEVPGGSGVHTAEDGSVGGSDRSAGGRDGVGTDRPGGRGDRSGDPGARDRSTGLTERPGSDPTSDRGGESDQAGGRDGAGRTDLTDDAGRDDAGSHRDNDMFRHRDGEGGQHPQAGDQGGGDHSGGDHNGGDHGTGEHGGEQPGEHPSGQQIVDEHPEWREHPEQVLTDTGTDHGRLENAAPVPDRVDPTDTDHVTVDQDSGLITHVTVDGRDVPIDQHVESTSDKWALDAKQKAEDPNDPSLRRKDLRPCLSLSFDPRTGHFADGVNGEQMPMEEGTTHPTIKRAWERTQRFIDDLGELAKPREERTDPEGLDRRVAADPELKALADNETPENLGKLADGMRSMASDGPHAELKAANRLLLIREAMGGEEAGFPTDERGLSELISDPHSPVAKTDGFHPDVKSRYDTPEDGHPHEASPMPSCPVCSKTMPETRSLSGNRLAHPGNVVRGYEGETPLRSPDGETVKVNLNGDPRNWREHPETFLHGDDPAVQRPPGEESGPSGRPPENPEDPGGKPVGPRDGNPPGEAPGGAKPPVEHTGTDQVSTEHTGTEHTGTERPTEERPGQQAESPESPEKPAEPKGTEQAEHPENPAGAEHPGEHPGEQPGERRNPYGDDHRPKLGERIRDRVNRFFERLNPEHRAMVRERQAYERNLHELRETVRQAVEGDPRVQAARAEAATHNQNKMNAEGEANNERWRAWHARQEAQQARRFGDQMTDQANQRHPNDPQGHTERQQARAAYEHAKLKEAEATNLDSAAALHDARARAEHDQMTQAVDRANDLTRSAVANNDALWRFVNVESEGAHPGLHLVDYPDDPNVNRVRPSQVTGGHPPEVSRNRPYGQKWGLRRPLVQDQRNMEESVPVGPDGRPERAPNPRGRWVRMINAFGLHADPTRTQNCVDCVASLIDTFVHGRPTVAAPRSLDGFLHGDPNRPFNGESGGAGRMERLTGGRYQALTDDLKGLPQDVAAQRVNEAYRKIEAQLGAGDPAKHGSLVVISSNWREGGAHVWAAVNYHGEVHYVDPQSGKSYQLHVRNGEHVFHNSEDGTWHREPIHTTSGTTKIEALAVDENGQAKAFDGMRRGMWSREQPNPEIISHLPEDDRTAALADVHRAESNPEHLKAQTSRNQAVAHHADARRHQTEADRQQRIESGQRRVAIEEGWRRDEARGQSDWHSRRAAQQDEAARQAMAANDPQRAAAHERAAEIERDQARRAAIRADQHEARRAQAEQTGRQAQHDAAQARDRATRSLNAEREAQQRHQISQRAAEGRGDHYARNARATADHYDRSANQHNADAATRQQSNDTRGADRETELANHAEQARNAYRTAASQQDMSLARERAAEQSWQRADGHARAADQAWRTGVEHENKRVEAEDLARFHEQRAQHARGQAAEFRRFNDAEHQQIADQYDRRAADSDRAAAEHRRQAAAEAQARDRATAEVQRHTAAEQAARDDANRAFNDALSARNTRDAAHTAARDLHVGYDRRRSNPADLAPAGEHQGGAEPSREQRDDLDRAREAAGRHAPAVTDAVHAAAGEAGGSRVEHPAVEDGNQAHQRLGDQVAERPEQPEGRPDSRLRYSVELPSEGYPERAQAVVDDLASRGYEPVGMRDHWAAGRDGGLDTRWRDPATGQEFHVRLDTPESRAAHDAMRDWQAARHDGTDPAGQRELEARQRDLRAATEAPAGTDRVHLPEHTGADHTTPDHTARGDDPTSMGDVPLHERPMVHGAEALQAVRDTLRPGRNDVLDLTDDPRIAERLEHLEGRDVAKVALHGLPDGTVVVGDVRMSREDLVEALGTLKDEGRLNLDGKTMRLVSCYSADGGDRSLAAQLARRLGVEVVGATDKVWVYNNGVEVVSSPHPDNPSRPTDPPDGEWKRYGADGSEIESLSGGMRPDVVLHQDSDGRLRASGDTLDQYRTPDGRLHHFGDRRSSYRDDVGFRLHHDGDPAGTYRSEKNFRLMSYDGKPVRDPLAHQAGPVDHRAVQGNREQYHGAMGSEVHDAHQAVHDAEQARDDFRRDVLQPLKDELGVGDRNRFTRSVLSDLAAEHPDDVHWQDKVEQLRDAARADRVNQAAVTHARTELGRAVGHQVLANEGIDGDRVLAGRNPHDTRRGGEFAVAGFDPVNHRLVVLETTDPHGTTHVMQEGTRTERGTAEYVRDILETSPRLQEQLRAHPELLDELHRALERGDLTIDVRRVETTVDGQGALEVHTRTLDTSGFDRTGVTDHLPAHSGAADPHAADRLGTAAGHVADATGGRMTDPHTMEITPERGRSYRAELSVVDGQKEPFKVTLGDDGTHRIEFSGEALDKLDAAGVDRLTARAVGHLKGEAAASAGNRLGRFLGMHGGRQAGHDALDPEGRQGSRLSHADIVHIGEYDAQSRLLEHTTEPAAREALERELNTFITEHGLRDGLPGADHRADLMRPRLSEPTRAALDDQRAWWKDGDPAAAGTRKHLLSVFPRAEITPAEDVGRGVYDVRPEGWDKSEKRPFTIEVRSGEVTDGKIAEFRGTRRLRHFVLVVDRDAFHDLGLRDDPQGFKAHRFHRDLREVINNKIDQQANRPTERPAGFLARILRDSPTAAAGGAGLGFTKMLGHPELMLKGTVRAGFDLVTGDRARRFIDRDSDLAKQHRALGERPDIEGMDPDAVQKGIDEGFDKAGNLAEDMFGDRGMVDRSTVPAPDRQAGGVHRPISEREGRVVRQRTADEMRDLVRERKNHGIEHLVKVKARRDGSYRLIIRGAGNDAIVRFEPGTTKRPDKLDVDYTSHNEATVWVPKELENAQDSSFHDAVRETIEGMAKRQFDVNRDQAGVEQHVEEGLINEIHRSLLPSFPAEDLANHLGQAIGVSGTVQSVFKAIGDRILGHYASEQGDRTERWDYDHSAHFTDDHRRNLGKQVVELTHNGEKVADGLNDMMDGKVPAAPAPNHPATGHDIARKATVDAIADVVRNHPDTRFEIGQRTDRNGNTTITLRSKDLGLRRNFALELSMRDVPDDTRALMSGGRVSRGHFKLILNEHADPQLIREKLGGFADAVLHDREEKLPFKRRLYEDFFPAATRIGGAAAVGAVSPSHQLAAGALAAAGAGAHMIERAVNRISLIRAHDTELNKWLGYYSSPDDIPSETLRGAIESQRTPVEAAEQRVRDLEQQLANDPRTAAQVQDLRNRLGDIPTADHDLLPGVERELANRADLSNGAKLSAVGDARNTYRVSFRGPDRRPEHITFEVASGETAGATLAAHRLDSDVTYAVRVDPNASPHEVANAVHTWLNHELERTANGPDGLPSGKARVVTFVREGAGQAAASIASLSVGSHPHMVQSIIEQAGWAGSGTAGVGSTEVANASRAGHLAVSDQTRYEVMLRRFGTATESHVTLIASDSDHLMDRTAFAHARLQHLENIADTLPAADRPDMLRNGHLTRDDRDPIAMGGDDPAHPGGEAGVHNGHSGDPVDHISQSLQLHGANGTNGANGAHPNGENGAARNGAPAGEARDGATHPAGRTAAVRDLEQRIGAAMFADPKASEAADAALHRLTDVLVGLNHDPNGDVSVEETRRQVEEMLFSDDFRNAGQVTGAATLADVHESGNLRVKMTTFFNGVMESHHPLDLEHSLRNALSQPDWVERVRRAGLDPEQLAPVRDRMLALDDPNIMRTDVLAGDTAHSRLAIAEHKLSQGARTERNAAEQFPYLKSKEHYEKAGIGLHPAERAALSANDRLTLTFRHSESVPLDALPRTETGEPDFAALRERPDVRGVHVTYDRHPSGEYVTDGNGHRVVRDVYLDVVDGQREVNPRDYDLPAGMHGPELPVGWVSGEARYSLDPNHEWYRELDKLGLTGISGLSGTAGRLLTVHDWLGTPGGRSDEFLHALIGWMLPTGDHSLYEIVRGAQMAHPGMFGEPGRGFTGMSDLLHRIPGVAGNERFADLLHAADALPDTERAGTDLLGHAATVRADDGTVDDNALRRFLDPIPTVPGLTGHPTMHELADLLRGAGAGEHPGAAEREAVRRFAAEALGRDPAELGPLERVGGQGGAKGASGAPVFFVRDTEGALVGVVKVFPDMPEAAREVAGIHRLHEENFEHLAVPEVRGLGVARADDAAGGVLVSAVAEGKPLDDHLAAIRDAATPEQRQAAVDEAKQAFHATGLALAEMHNVPEGSGERVADWFPDREGTDRITRMLHRWATDPEFQRAFGFDGQALVDRFGELEGQLRADGGPSALVHGDPHPGNFFFDAKTGKATIIDLEGVHASMDGAGHPVGAAALDHGVFGHVLSAFAHNFEVGPVLPELREAFESGYHEFGGHPIPEHAQAFYKAGGLALALNGTREVWAGEHGPDGGPLEAYPHRAAEQLGELHDILGLRRPPALSDPWSDPTALHADPAGHTPDGHIRPTDVHAPAGDEGGQAAPGGLEYRAGQDPLHATVDHPDRPHEAGGRPLADAVPRDPVTGERLPLFDGEPKRDNVKQGSLGDCGYISTLRAVAAHHPEAIRDAIRENPDGTYTVTFYETGDPRSLWAPNDVVNPAHDVEGGGLANWWEPTGRKVELTLTADVPVFEGTTEAASCQVEHDGVFWPALMEKAFAAHDATWPVPPADENGNPPPRGYSRLHHKGSSVWMDGRHMSELTGKPAQFRWTVGVSDETLAAELRGHLAADEPVLVGSLPHESGELPHRLLAGHSYELVAIHDDNSVELRNPWGFRHPDRMSLAEFRQYTETSFVTLVDEVPESARSHPPADGAEPAHTATAVHTAATGHAGTDLRPTTVDDPTAPRAGETTTDHVPTPEHAESTNDHAPAGNEGGHEASGGLEYHDGRDPLRATVDHPNRPPKVGGTRPLADAVPKDPRTGERLPLFNGEPKRGDANQGALGDCGCITSLRAVAGHYPEAIRDAIRENPDGTYTVTFHEIGDPKDLWTPNKLMDTAFKYGDGSFIRFWAPSGRTVELTITPDMPVYRGTERAAFAQVRHNGVFWPAIMEKAFAAHDATWPSPQADEHGNLPPQGYSRLGRGSTPWMDARRMSELTGKPSMLRWTTGMSDDLLASELREHLAKNHPIRIGTLAPETKHGTPAELPYRLVPAHAYELVAIHDDNSVELRNPWGFRHPRRMSLGAFREHTRPFYAAVIDELPDYARPQPPAPDGADDGGIRPLSDHGQPVEAPAPPVPVDAEHAMPPEVAGSATVDHPALADRPWFTRKVHFGVPVDKATGEPAPLFAGEPNRDQVRQGELGNCGVVSTVGAVAGHFPHLVDDLVRDNGDGTFRVTLHEVKLDNAGRRAEPTGRVIELDVTPEVPTFRRGGGSAYMDASENGSRWASILEKGIAGQDAAWPADRQARLDETGYARIVGPSSRDEVELLAQLTGRPAESHALPRIRGLSRDMDTSALETDVVNELAAHLEANSPVLVGTAGRMGDKLPFHLIGGHAYEVVGIRDGLVELHNPWGYKHPEPMPVRDFLEHNAGGYVTLAEDPAGHPLLDHPEDGDARVGGREAPPDPNTDWRSLPPIPEADDPAFQAAHARAVQIADDQLANANSLEGDGKYWFAKVYHHVTVNELRMIAEGRYQDPLMKLREVDAFHETYQRNLDAWLANDRDSVEPNWHRAFTAAESMNGGSLIRPRSMEVLKCILPAMQAHIRFDLPRAIASVYEEHYASSGRSLDEFADDFYAMQPVFDVASQELTGEIREQTWLTDPGRYDIAQRIGMRTIFNVPVERTHAWNKALEIVAGHRDGITTQAEMQRRLEAYSRRSHPITARNDYRIDHHTVDTYDWNNQHHRTGGADNSGPWADGVGEVHPGGAVPQSRPGSCVSAVGEMLTGGALTESELLAELGEWATPTELRDLLNQRSGHSDWQGGFFGDEEQALAIVSRGPTGVVLQAFGASRHMVLVEPLGNDRFQVRDPLPGVTYEVGADWIRQYAGGGVFR